MICGSPSMLTDLRSILQRAASTKAIIGEPGHYVIEKAFVEK